MRTWSDVFADSEGRTLAESIIEPWFVSTVWLGVDQRKLWMGDGPPLIFETIVFGPTQQPVKLDDHTLQWLWTYERQARIGHRDVASFVREVLEGVSSAR